MRTLEDADRLSVPFTTGLLVGIGETLRDRAGPVFAVRASHARHGHVQEVIVQDFRPRTTPPCGPRPTPAWRSTSPPSP